MKTLIALAILAVSAVMLLFVYFGPDAPTAFLLALQPGEQGEEYSWPNFQQFPFQGMEQNVRESAVAGTFYPGEEAGLRAMVEEYLAKAGEAEIPRVMGLVSPHAGYPFSGQVAAAGFKQLAKDRDSYKTVVIIGQTHYARFDGASIASASHYETPLGLVRLSPKAEQLRKEPGFGSVGEAHLQEHSIETQLPFLQSVLGEFEIIPIVVGNMDAGRLASALLEYIDEETLIVASTDLSHYYSYEQALALDKKCIDAIPGLDFEGMQQCEACGKTAVLALMRIAEEKGWKGSAVSYMNSGDTSGDKGRVVGYLSAAFHEETLSEEEQGFLLQLARETLGSYLSRKELPAIDESRLTPKLREKQACFVTLNKNHELRGCTGHVTAQVELFNCVIENAVNAAVRDERFDPVTFEELRGIEIEVSVLSSPKRLQYGSQRELLEKIRPGIDGVVITYEGKSSTYLPTVWEQIPNKVQFLSSLCLKQQSQPGCWAKPGAVIETYTGFAFHEE